MRVEALLRKSVNYQFPFQFLWCQNSDINGIRYFVKFYWIACVKSWIIGLVISAWSSQWKKILHISRYLLSKYFYTDEVNYIAWTWSVLRCVDLCDSHRIYSLFFVATKISRVKICFVLLRLTKARAVRIHCKMNVSDVLRVEMVIFNSVKVSLRCNVFSIKIFTSKFEW